MVGTNMRRVAFLVLLSLTVLFSSSALAQQKAPPKLQAALLMKLLAFYNNLGDGPFTIHVIGAPEVAAELKGLVGKPTGKASLSGVTEGDISSSAGAKVIYVGTDVAGSIGYTQSNGVLSVTGVPSYVTDGVTLGVAVENNKPVILLNLSSSKAEGINWNPAILKVAETI